MRKLLIAVVVLIGLFVAADRIALVVAEHQVSDKLAASYNLPQKPGVSIHGFPFLTEVATGQFQQVNVSVPSLENNNVPVQNLDAQFTSVHAPVRQIVGGGSGPIGADQATGTALVPYSAVNKQLPAGVTVSPAGSSLKMSGTTSFLGRQVPFSATGSVGVTGNGITIKPHDVTVDGQSGVPASAIGPLSVGIPVSSLPFHLALNSVQPSASGLQVSVSAQNVEFQSAG
jgi:LmeA-like phospholipid-binding